MLGFDNEVHQTQASEKSVNSSSAELQEMKQIT